MTRTPPNIPHLCDYYVRQFSAYPSPVQSYKKNTHHPSTARHTKHIFSFFFLKVLLKVLKLEKSQHLLQGEFTDLFNHTGDGGVLMQQVSKMLRA